MREKFAKTWGPSVSSRRRVRSEQIEADLFWEELLGFSGWTGRGGEAFGPRANEIYELDEPEGLDYDASYESDEEAEDIGAPEPYEEEGFGGWTGQGGEEFGPRANEIYELDEPEGVDYDASYESDEEAEDIGLPGLYEEDYPEEGPLAPMAVPSSDPVPFAPNPSSGSYWPLISTHPRNREINYRASDGSRVGSNTARQFLASRGGGARYHVGVDLYGNRGDPVVAIADGRIVRFFGFCCGDNKTSWAVMVQHANVVVNYGEVSPDSLTRNGLRRGSSVRAGAVIGSIGVNPGGSSMLHFETYVLGTTANARWMRGRRRPPSLLNPTPYLLWLVQHGRTGTATGTGAPSPRPVSPQTPATPTISTGTTASPTRNWTGMSNDQRMRYVMRLLVRTYRYPVNAAAGVVGNLWAESGVLPNRIEGSQRATPMRARNFQGVLTTFTADQVMNRNRSTGQGPRRPGVGLAQWTTQSRRSGLFRHSFHGRILGSAILNDMDAQVDYLVSELASRYNRVERVLRNQQVSVNDASDEVVYSYEIPAAVLTNTRPRRKLPRSNAAVQEVFARRRRFSQAALRAYQASP